MWEFTSCILNPLYVVVCLFGRLPNACGWFCGVCFLFCLPSSVCPSVPPCAITAIIYHPVRNYAWTQLCVKLNFKRKQDSTCRLCRPVYSNNLANFTLSSLSLPLAVSVSRFYLHSYVCLWPTVRCHVAHGNWKYSEIAYPTWPKTINIDERPNAFCGRFEMST